jgi:hypothetical protein
MKRFALVVLVLLAACAPQATPTPTPRGRLVTRAEFGERWPFTVESGVLDCIGVGEAVFRVGNVTYAINGTARSWADRHGYVDLADSLIWRDDPAHPGMGLKVYIGGMIQLALQQCD